MSPSAPHAYRGLVFLLMTLAVAWLLVGPSDASPKGRTTMLLLSTDSGRHWQTKLTKPLFDPDFRWVPGDSVTEHLYVRNVSGEDAWMTISMSITDRTGLIRSGQLRVDVKAFFQWARVSRATGQRLFRVKIRANAIRRIWVRVSLLPGARNASMDRRLPFSVQLRLTSVRA